MKLKLVNREIEPYRAIAAAGVGVTTFDVLILAIEDTWTPA